MAPRPQKQPPVPEPTATAANVLPDCVSGQEARCEPIQNLESASESWIAVFCACAGTL
jgi:hypothetical protein